VESVGAPPLSQWQRLARAARSVVFLLIFLGYLLIPMGLVQRLIVFPLARLRPPSHRYRMLGVWMNFHARVVLRMLTVLGGVRISLDGPKISGSALVVMNHQSLLDIVVAKAIVSFPVLLTAVRSRYLYGIPGVSPFLRAGNHPAVTQKRESLAADLAAMEEAADRTARGWTSFLIYPEGHRSKTGEIGRFMPRGLSIALARTRRPVYAVVIDGVWQVRTFMDTIVGLPGTHLRAVVTGPFDPPETEAEIPGFITALRDGMIATLAELRGASRG
jgi:1-acyl-sn-glycerol-3-phosphate acyltransferase